MPDHVHLVVEGQTDGSNCREFARAFKQRTAFAWKKRTGQRLWQKSFYDHVLRETETVQGVVGYVLENPVRAELARSPAEYAHSGSFVYERTELIEWAFGNSVGPDLPACIRESLDHNET
jgi:hypothetical protein